MAHAMIPLWYREKMGDVTSGLGEICVRFSDVGRKLVFGFGQYSQYSFTGRRFLGDYGPLDDMGPFREELILKF